MPKKSIINLNVKVKKMRKFLLSVAAVLFTCCLGAYAAPVDKAKAMKLAGEFFTSHAAKSGKSPKKVSLKMANKPTGEGDNSLLYIFNNEDGKGYVIVAGDDRVQNILAFSEEGSLTEESFRDNTSLKWLLGEYEQQITWVINNLPEKPSKMSARKIGEYEIQMNPLLDYDNDRITRLPQTISWGQDWPFNKFAPYVNYSNGTRKQTVSGCVATAISTVMRWHKWPERPRGQLSYRWNGITMSLNFDGTGPENAPYDWNNMPAAVTSTGTNRQTGRRCTEVESDNIGRLLRDVGYAVRMNYGVASQGGSGTQLYYAPNPLITNFGYDDNLTHIYRSAYTSQQWWNEIVDELSTYGPIVYAGISYYGGHCFVIDGYATNNYVHVDWGWNGMENGWFLLNVLEPGSEGIGGGGGGYSSNQQMLRYMRPGNGGEAPVDPLKVSDLYIYTPANGRVLSAKDQVVTVDVGNMHKRDNYNGVLYLAVLPVTSTSTSAAIVATANNISIPAEGHTLVRFNADLSNLDKGKYNVFVAGRIGSMEAIPEIAGEIEIVGDNGGNVDPTPTPDPVVDYRLSGAEIAQVNTQQGIASTFSMKLKNTGLGMFDNIIKVYATQGYSIYSGKQIAEQRCQIGANSEKTITFSTNVTYNTLAAGEYKLMLRYIDKDGQEVSMYLDGGIYESVLGKMTISENVAPQVQDFNLDITERTEVSTVMGVQSNINIMVNNTGNGAYNDAFTLYAVPKSSTSFADRVLISTVAGKIDADTKKTIVFSTNEAYKSLAAGEYKLVVGYKKEGAEQYLRLAGLTSNWIATLTIGEEQVQRTDAFKMSIPAEFTARTTQGAESTIAVTLHNSGSGSFNDVVRIYATSGYSYYTAKLIAEQECALKVGETKTFTFTTNDTYNTFKEGEYKIIIRVLRNDREEYVYLNNTYNDKSGKLIVEPGIGGTTGINEVATGASSDAMFNLGGQRVSKEYKGVVIVNGKKVVKK